MKYFADNLKLLRKDRGLSQDQLAERLGLNRGNIASYEKRIAEPKLENLLKIVKFFNIEFRDLIETDLNHRVALKEGFEKMGKNGSANNLPGLSDEDLKIELLNNKRKLESFAKQSDSMQKILDGFRQFHHFKMGKSKEVSEEVKKMASDYEQLMDLMEDLLQANQEIITSLNPSDAEE